MSNNCAAEIHQGAALQPRFLPGVYLGNNQDYKTHALAAQQIDDKTVVKLLLSVVTENQLCVCI